MCNQTCRICPLIPLPRLEVRVGAHSPMRGVRLPHGTFFERERDRTCCYCSTFVPWDVCSTRHPYFHFGAASLTGCWLFSSCRGLTSACSFFVGGRDRTSCFSGSYNLFFPSSLACEGEMEDLFPMRGPGVKGEKLGHLL